MAACRTILRRDPEQIHVLNTYGFGPAHIAAMRGIDELMETVLDAGADPDQRNHDGETPLHYAANGGHASSVQMLLARGADIDAADQIGFL